MLENAQKQVDVAGWLEAEHFPAVRALNVDNRSSLNIE